MVTDAKKHKAEDEAEKEKIESRNSLYNYCCTLSNTF